MWKEHCGLGCHAAQRFTKKLSINLSSSSSCSLVYLSIIFIVPLPLPDRLTWRDSTTCSPYFIFTLALIERSVGLNRIRTLWQDPIPHIRYLYPILFYKCIQLSMELGRIGKLRNPSLCLIKRNKWESSELLPVQEVLTRYLQ